MWRSSKMANIKLESLNISGLDLFNDSESFIVELTDEEQQIVGGKNIDNITSICVVQSKEYCCAGFTFQGGSIYCTGNNPLP